VPSIIISDDFNDNSINTELWDKVEYNGASVAERNQRLEMTCPVGESGSGLVTKNPYTMSNVEISVLAHNTQVSTVMLLISLTKTTNSNPHDENNWYKVMLYHHNNYNRFYAQKKVGGTVTTLYSGSWLSSQEVIKLRIEDDTVKFMEQDVVRATDTWSLPSRSCYIYIVTRSGSPTYTGTDWADNFVVTSLAVEETPISAKALYNTIAIPETPISAKALYNAITITETPISAKALYNVLIPNVNVIVTNENVTPNSGFVGDSVTYSAIVKDEYGNPLPESFMADLLMNSTVVIDNQYFVAGVYDSSTGELTLVFTVPDITAGTKTVKLKWEEQTI